ncbi:MAG: hypothetical protein LC781_22625 [Actinobacteria bacterium]|nr:hypothetical protein [Actinomycetota bacterium]
MGMFDYVRVEGHPLPGLDPKLLDKRQDENESLAEGPAVFQTKDLENYLGTYVIKDGRLFRRIYERERVPEEEHPYHGKPEWDEGGEVFGKYHYRWVGSTRIVGHKDVDLDYHGDVRFYASKKELGLAEDRGSGWVEFKARFTRGDLEWIRPVE